MLISLLGYKMLRLVKYDVMLLKSTERQLSDKSHIMRGSIHPLYLQTSFSLSTSRRGEKKEETT